MTIAADARLLRLEDAQARVLDGVRPLPSELAELEDAAGRVLAAPVASRETLPPFENSAMDGFAVRSEDVRGATLKRPVALRVTGESAAGHVASIALEPRSAIRITTGAMLPAGADAVVPVEDTDAAPGASRLPGTVDVMAPAAPGAHVRHAGEDVRAGASILARGRLVGPAATALLAATGIGRVAVHRRPRLAVLSTGDELLPVEAPLRPGTIHDSNSPALVAQARASGAVARSYGIVPDDPEVLRDRLAEAVAGSDVVVLSGGVSVGAHDHVRDAFAALGEVAVWRVAIQPGKPFAFGRARARQADGEERTVALFGLPGNPVSAFVTFELFVRPVLRIMAGRDDALGRRRRVGVLAEPVSKAPGRRAFLRVRIEPLPDGRERVLVRPAGGQASHMISSLAAADGLAIVPEDVPELPAGAEVEVWELQDEGA